jgi:hypothetical protein
MKKTEKFDYLLFAGKTKDDLRPACAYKSKEDAIKAAKRLDAEKISGMKCIEVVLMPEDDDDTNEVVWSNCGRK